jgi:hypothetical protein
MPEFSAKQKKMRKTPRSKRPFLLLFRNVKRSKAYHSLSPVARCALVELIDRYNGTNNGRIGLGVRELAYEVHCSKDTAAMALKELDDAGLARPITPGVWRGRRATEWCLTFHLCNETGELPVTQWEQRQPFIEEPQKARKAPSNAERQRRFRQRHRNDNRNDEYGCRDMEVRQQGHKLLSSPTKRTEALQKPQNHIDPSPAAGTHVHMYQGEVKPAETPVMDDYPELPECLRRKSEQTGMKVKTY